MQKARIRTGWKNKGKIVSVAEFANALSAVCWRMSLNAAKNLHQQDFVYDNDSQRLGVIREYLFFFVHCADRLMFDHFEQADRIDFVTALTMDCRRHYVENAQQIFDSSVSKEHFIEQLNATTSGMAGLSFKEGEPGFDMYRMLGTRIQDIMGSSQTNKWVIDQIMDIDGPEAFETFSKSFAKLKKSSNF